MQRRLMQILDGSSKDHYSKAVEWMITFVVLTNCLAVVLDSVPDIHADYKEFFHEFEFWSVMFFSAEYVLRAWSYGARYKATNGGSWKGRKEYMLSFFGLIDFFCDGTVLFAHVFSVPRFAGAARASTAAYPQTLELQHSVTRLICRHQIRTAGIYVGAVFAHDRDYCLCVSDVFCGRSRSA